jgi:hypothetical protein
MHIEKTYNSEPTLEKFHHSDAFYRGIRGPVRSGKSTGCSWEIFMRALDQNKAPDGIRYSKWVVVRNTYRELEDTTLKTWQMWFGHIGRFNQRTMTHKIVINDIDMEVLFRALDRPDDVKHLLSLEITGAWVNEAREVPKIIIDTLGDRVGQYPPPELGGCKWFGVFMDTNPPDEDHWWYKLAEVESPAGRLPDWDFFTQPGGLIEQDNEFKPNPKAENIQNLNEKYDYYLKRLQGKSKDYVRVYYCGQYGFVQDGKPVHPEYVDSLHCASEVLKPIPGIPIIIGLDFGLTPAAVFSQRKDNGQYHIFDEIATQDIGVKRFGELLLAPKLNGEYSGYDFEIWGDPGSGRAETDEHTAFSILETIGIKVSPSPSQNPSVRRESLAAPFTRIIDGLPGCIISPKCIQLRKGLAGKYMYRRVKVSGDERFHDKPDKNFWSHVCEAAEYGMVGAGEGNKLMYDETNYDSAEKHIQMQSPTTHIQNNWMGM